MEKVQTNLIQNAINYTPRGGNVSVSVERLHGRLALIVRDTGVGISTEDLPHVFEPFYKGRHEGDGYTQGTGLGLTIVKRTVGDFGGKILVESQVGEGTTMTVLLKERQSG
jgi:signal transduction histidine kinase